MFRVLLLAVVTSQGILGSLNYRLAANARAVDHELKSDFPRPPTAYSNNNWLGWGAGIYNNRVAPTGATVDVSNVASLDQVCHEEYTVGVSATPLVIDGKAYFPTWGGLLVAYDYHRCKMLWQTNVTDIILAFKPVSAPISNVVAAVSRTTPVTDGHILFLGTQANALLLAINKRTGTLVDRIQINDHPTAIVTMSPTIWQGKIFVGAASNEESAAGLIPGYICCSFIGNMNGLAFHRGRFHLLWNVPMVPAGSNFSGGPIWGSQPSIDPARKQVFIATGNVYSVPDSYEICANQTSNSTTTNSTTLPNTTDPCTPSRLYQESVIAFDTATGHINWFHQLSPLDAWNVACVGPPIAQNPGACPSQPGPDADFGMAPTFVPGSSQTPSGQDIIVVGQKNGNLYGIFAQDGTLLWATATSPTGLIGGLIWGIAADDHAAYYTGVNTERLPWTLKDGTKLSNGAFGALSLATGDIIWETQVPRNSTSLVSPSVVNDVVFFGIGGPYTGSAFDRGSPGSLLSLNKYTGAIIEEVGLNEYFQGGIAIVKDYVLFGTGYRYLENGSFNVFKVIDKSKKDIR